MLTSPNIIRNKSFFITGGAGFIMSNFISTIIDNNRVTILDTFDRDSISNSPFISHSNLSIIKGSVLDTTLLSAIEPHDVIIHAAGIAGIYTVLQNPVKTMEVNYLGTSNMLAMASKWQNLQKFLNFSTSEVFGQVSFKAAEEDIKSIGDASQARWTYAVSKMAGEHLCFSYLRQEKVPIVNLRPFNVYGPRQTGESAISTFIKQALKHEKIVIHGDGTQIRAWCYVSDFVEVMHKIILSERSIGESFNIGDTHSTITILGLARKIKQLLLSESEICFVDSLKEDVNLRIPSAEKARKILEFNSQITLDEGILLTASWYRNNS
jgi:UDP-glucose 4-epimerase